MIDRAHGLDPGPITAIREGSESLPDLADTEAFGAAFERFADAKIVLLGEASHGTSEFYRARDAITRTLVARHGFSIVAVEADWPDAARIDRHVRHLAGGHYDEEAFARFPTWMWRNREVETFVEWMRAFNADQPPRERAAFRGLDVYSLRSSISAVLDYLNKVDPEAAARARGRYGCLTPWQGEPRRYGLSVLRGQQDPCEEAVVAQLREMLERRLELSAKDGDGYFDAAQNARVVRAAEQYYRIMYRGSTESWNLRDRHMFNTLQHLFSSDPTAKAVVWAHNSHIGNAAATAMGWEGQFNIGELAKTAHGEKAVAIGFGTGTGTVAAADDWDEPMKVKRIVPARSDSYEGLYAEAGIPCSLTDLRRDDMPAREALSEARLERAIGVIYRPETERASHYFDAVLPEQFEAYVWFDTTTAVTPLPSVRPHGMPETYPFGT